MRHSLRWQSQKLLPVKKSWKDKILRFSHPWKIQNEVWFKQGKSWSKYISYSSKIIFLEPFFFQLWFCNISQISLYLTSFFSCCFFCCLNFATERKVPIISSFFSSIWNSLSGFSCRVKSRWMTALPLTVAVTSHGTSSPTWTKLTYNNWL